MEEFHLKSEEESLQSIVTRLGNPVSTVMLGSDYRIFRVPEIDGIIGYQLIRNCAVVLGDPVSLPEHESKLVKAFHLYCTKNALRIVYFLTSRTFAHWALNNGYKTLIQCSEEAIVNPQRFQMKQKLRWKFNHSLNQGVQIKEYKTFDCSLEKEIKEAIVNWLKTKKSSRIYLGNIHSIEDKRVFYAVKDEKIVGLLTLARIDRFQGWVITSFFAIHEAPAGVTEHLICSVIDVLSKENCEFLCLGIVAKPNLEEIVGLSSLSKFLVNLIFRLSHWLFPLDTRINYFHKYRPYFCPMYVLFSGKLNLNELIAIKKILNVKL